MSEILTDFCGLAAKHWPIYALGIILAVFLKVIIYSLYYFVIFGIHLPLSIVIDIIRLPFSREKDSDDISWVKKAFKVIYSKAGLFQTYLAENRSIAGIKIPPSWLMSLQDIALRGYRKLCMRYVLMTKAISDGMREVRAGIDRIERDAVSVQTPSVFKRIAHVIMTVIWAILLLPVLLASPVLYILIVSPLFLPLVWFILYIDFMFNYY